VSSLTTVLPGFLGIPVVFHITARRLFINQAATHYTTDFNKTAPKLVLNFTSPVNPSIGTEPGKLHMVFQRDPLLPSGPDTTDFDSKTISSASFQESNGAAEITVAGSVPLLASFSNNGRTITIAPVPSSPPSPAAGAAAKPTPAPTSAPPAASTSSARPPASALPPAPLRRVFAVLDASHGGDDRGAALGQLAEKDITLAFARRIREELQTRGIPALVLRDSDTSMTLDQRASLANGTRSTIYIAVHAASDGLGVRVCTALMPAAGTNSGPFLAWDSAQSQFLPAAQAAAGTLAAELRKKLPVRLVAAPLRPLNNITMPALAIEVASQTGDLSELASPAYQQLVAAAVADGVVTSRDKMGAGR
jgi:N-acetylmuramoyl-L-alanine amidase